MRIKKDPLKKTVRFFYTRDIIAIQQTSEMTLLLLEHENNLLFSIEKIA